MAKHKNLTSQFAICINTDDPDLLTPRMIYKFYQTRERKNLTMFESSTTKVKIIFILQIISLFLTFLLRLNALYCRHHNSEAPNSNRKGSASKRRLTSACSGARSHVRIIPELRRAR